MMAHDKTSNAEMHLTNQLAGQFSLLEIKSLRVCVSIISKHNRHNLSNTHTVVQL